jgi:hypothetical protein
MEPSTAYGTSLEYVIALLHHVLSGVTICSVQRSQNHRVLRNYFFFFLNCVFDLRNKKFSSLSANTELQGSYVSSEKDSGRHNLLFGMKV